MKIDTREDALHEAQRLVGATEDELADALLEAHLEGLDQGHSVAGKENAATELMNRRIFVLGQMKKDTSFL